MTNVTPISRLIGEERTRRESESWQRIQRSYAELANARDEAAPPCPHCHEAGLDQGLLTIEAHNATQDRLDSFIARKRAEGFGYVGCEVRDDGTALVRLYCVCEAGRIMQQSVYERYAAEWRDSGIPPRYRDFSFSTWDKLPSTIRHANALAYHAALLFSQRAGEGHWFRMSEVFQRAKRESTMKSDPARNGLVLYGGVGRGKTGLAASIASAVQGVEPYLFVRVQKLIARIQDTYGKRPDDKGKIKESRAQILQRLQNVPLLILDELTLEIDARKSGDRAEIIEHIIRHRHEWQLPIVITTNYNRARFVQAWGERISDVLLENSHWIPLQGDNARHKEQPE